MPWLDLHLGDGVGGDIRRETGHLPATLGPRSRYCERVCGCGQGNGEERVELHCAGVLVLNSANDVEGNDDSLDLELLLSFCFSSFLLVGWKWPRREMVAAAGFPVYIKLSSYWQLVFRCVIDSRIASIRSAASHIDFCAVALLTWCYFRAFDCLCPLIGTPHVPNPPASLLREDRDPYFLPIVLFCPSTRIQTSDAFIVPPFACTLQANRSPSLPDSPSGSAIPGRV